MNTIFVAGHKGMVGTALVRRLQGRADTRILTRTRKELDLTNQTAVATFFEYEKIDQVYVAAAKVGGIHANNTYPADFIYDNLMIECNLIHSAYNTDVKKLLFLGSSCIYPRAVEQPMKESALLTGVLEQTNEPYAVAKIAGIKLCESYTRQHGCDFRSVMPTNLYGPHDNFHPENSHVIPSLLRRFHDAKEMEISEIKVWGTGMAMREFLHVSDMAAACELIMGLEREVYDAITEPMISHINVGSGIDCTIEELAETVAKVVGYQGNLVWDHSKPDGAPRKLMDNSRLKALGWSPTLSLEHGLQDTYRWFLANQAVFRR